MWRWCLRNKRDLEKDLSELLEDTYCPMIRASCNKACVCLDLTKDGKKSVAKCDFFKLLIGDYYDRGN